MQLTSSPRITGGSGGGGGGSIGGAIAATQVAFGSGTNTIAGDSIFTYDTTGKILSVFGSTASLNVNFSGAGLDDLSASGTYSGAGSEVDLIVVSNAGDNEIDLSGRAGGNFSTSETVTSSSGGSATLVFDGAQGGATQIYVSGVTGTFNNGDTVTGGSSGATGTVTSNTTLSADTFAWYDSNGSGPIGSVAFLQMTGSSQSLTGTGVSVTWGATTGHTDQDSWTISNQTSTVGQINTKLFAGYAYNFNDGDGSNHVSISANNIMPSDYSLVLPQGQGTGALTNDGTGNLTWVPGGGGGSPGGSDTNVQFNDANAFGGDSNFTWDKTDRQFQVGDLADGFNHTKFLLNDQAQSITLQSPLGQVGLGDIAEVGNHIKLLVSDGFSKILAQGNKVVTPASASTPVFTGSGFDNLVVSSAGSPVSSVNYTVTVDGVDVNRIYYTTFTGTFSPGDTLTTGSGATGTVIEDDGTYLVVQMAGAPYFAASDAITDTTSGGTLTVDSVNSGQDGDTVTWTDGVTTSTYNPLVYQFAGAIHLPDGTNIATSNTNIQGHVLGDFWTFTVTPASTTFGSMLSLDGANNLFKVGDVDDIGNKFKLSINDASKINILNSPLGVTKIGDPLTAGNGVLFQADDLNQFIGGNIPGTGGGSSFSFIGGSGAPTINLLAGGSSATSLVLNGGTATESATLKAVTQGNTDPVSLVLDYNAKTVTLASGNINYLQVQGTVPLVTLGDGSVVSALQLSPALAQIHIPAVSGLFSVTDTGNTSLISAQASSSANNGTFFKVNDETQTVTSAGTSIEPNIGSTTYGGTLNYSAGFVGKQRAFFTGSHSGTPSGVLLPTGVIAAIGTKFTVDDLGGLATTDPITLDAGTSNTITSTNGTAQIFDLNANGESVSIIKLSSTQWMVE